MYLNWKQWPWTPPLVVTQIPQLQPVQTIAQSFIDTAARTEMERVKANLQNIERRLASVEATAQQTKNDLLVLFNNTVRRV